MSDQKSVKEIVYQAIVDLSQVYGTANREQIIKATGLKFSIVDEAIKWLREEALAINRHKNGVFSPVLRHKEYSPSTTSLENGLVLIESGEQQMRVTPRIAGEIAKQCMGYAMAHGSSNIFKIAGSQ